ncbi:hypothetical protein LIA77_01417 [Sarocladium implicatum]|nr:hypothetical protein LIA77_01417 [Sarocladium implicatum]
MKLSIASLAATVALMATGTSATVFLGLRTGIDGSQSQVAWTNGTPDSCSGFTTIINGANNPCGIDFFVDGGNGPFTFEGCGGQGLSLERNHQFNSNCVFSQRTIKCGGGSKIEQKWDCH